MLATKLVAVTADFHGYVPEQIPECDLLVVAGDIGLRENFGGQLRGEVNNYARIHDWLILCAEYGVPIVSIAGNRDFDTGMFRLLPWTYLEDEGTEVTGFKIWGSPWSPTFGHWAFMDSEEGLAERYAKIPDDTEILVTHGPPRNHCDLTNDYGRGRINAGSTALAARIRELPNLKLVACGHIHEAHGRSDLGGVKIVNGSLVDEHYAPTYQPEVVSI